MFEHLARVEERFAALERELSRPEVARDAARYVKLAKEHAGLKPLVTKYRELKVTQDQLAQAEELQTTSDPDLRQLAEEEVKAARARIAQREDELREMLVSEEETAHRNVIVEIRAGTGGEEAALFVAVLLRMYGKYAEARRWSVELLDSRPTDLGGFKEVVFSVAGEDGYRDLRYESGVHRVQRVPVTESQGRIHTSTCTVAVLPEAEAVEVEINEEKDLEVAFFHSSGPGGQNVNKVATAVRLTHLPTGLVVTAQDERSQRQNRMRALRILRSRLLDMREREQQEERAGLRRSLIGSGERSERIRTYNFPQSRVTDHRINLTLYDLDHVLEGHLEELTEALRAHDRELRLKAFTQPPDARARPGTGTRAGAGSQAPVEK
jgi:peptide chain release factor 1